MLLKKIWLRILISIFLFVGLIYGILFLFKKQEIILKSAIQYIPSINIYFIEAEINKKKHLIGIDTGSACFLTLYKEILNTIPNKKLMKSSKWIDVHQNVYLSKTFTLDLVKFAKIDISNVLVWEENFHFITATGRHYPNLPVSNIKKSMEQTFRYYWL